ncbi:potassium channel subfamily K member 10-like isoform X1 [Thunnus albacares]|uniref:potassium channel subfamily K member 10-like isoform X1 n=1 Tax=Thunnus maccoyii TaxID=8240 RepID=UPI001C4C38AA|nr:potassium channel subfamily K member 10-like isoform X1 [Thunnus maccoyii]XP_044185894.1 potassium channel subfamily K member 10-like isoform X1 [Thunnus albacares]|eukprot:superscaffoldBa00001288_g9942
MKFPTENPRKPGNVNPPPVAVQTNLVPPKKVQSGMLQSSLVQASVATMQNPMGCSLPRLSVSTRPASMVASMEAVADGSAPFTMMKLKTVLAVFVVVVAYLVAGGLVFQALEQPFENNQKITITAEKAAFLQKHPCVSPDELEAIIKVRPAAGRYFSFTSALDVVPSGASGLLKPELHIDLTPFKLLTYSRLHQPPWNWI